MKSPKAPLLAKNARNGAPSGFVIEKWAKNKNAGLVGPAASLLLICGERLVYVSGPRGSF
jgi:hypothetical protein